MALDHDSEFFQIWHNLEDPDGGAEGTPGNKLWMVGSLLALIEIGGMCEWAFMGSENTLATACYLREAGLNELAFVLDQWITAIPGGVGQLDVPPQESQFWRARLNCEEPADLLSLDYQLQKLVETKGNACAEQFLRWYHAQA